MKQIKFRVPMRCNLCGHKIFQYLEYTGDRFHVAGMEQCKCIAGSYEVVGDPQLMIPINGKEVYEGDIAKCGNNEISEVLYGEFTVDDAGGYGESFCCGFYLDTTHTRVDGTTYGMIESVYNGMVIEIIGNTHQNPELLDGR